MPKCPADILSHVHQRNGVWRTPSNISRIAQPFGDRKSPIRNRLLLGAHYLFIRDLQSVLRVIVCVIDRFHTMRALKYSYNSKSIHQTNRAKELPQLEAVLWRSRIGRVWVATVWADCG